MDEHKRIGLGGGCHWCTEGVFVSLRGVDRVDQGWIASVPPFDTPSEAVIVHFDPAVISPAELIAVHLETHSATVDHGLRHKYRSAIYAFTENDLTEFSLLQKQMALALEGELVTRVLPFGFFRPSLPQYQDYYRSDPNRPFCRRYIRPKLNRLRRDRPELFLTLKQ